MPTASAVPPTCEAAAQTSLPPTKAPPPAKAPPPCVRTPQQARVASQQPLPATALRHHGTSIAQPSPTSPPATSVVSCIVGAVPPALSMQRPSPPYDGWDLLPEARATRSLYQDALATGNFDGAQLAVLAEMDRLIDGVVNCRIADPSVDPSGCLEPRPQMSALPPVVDDEDFTASLEGWVDVVYNPTEVAMRRTLEPMPRNPAATQWPQQRSPLAPAPAMHRCPPPSSTPRFVPVNDEWTRAEQPPPSSSHLLLRGLLLLRTPQLRRPSQRSLRC